MGHRKTCAIHQPNLFPRLATLAKIYAADTWIVLDDVQFARRDYQHRCRLAALADPHRQQWLSLPVHLPEGQATRINNVRLAEPNRCPILITRLIAQYYSKSPHWRELCEVLDALIPVISITDRLVTVAETSTRLLLDLLGWTGTITHASTYTPHAGRSRRLADLAYATGAHTYLCGTGGARYLDTQPFAAYGIEVRKFKPASTNNFSFDRHDNRVSVLHDLMKSGPRAVEAIVKPGLED